MRTIKFRGFAIHDKMWVYGNLVQGTSNTFILQVTSNDDYLCTFSKSNSHLFVAVIPESVGQYTGLNDKNGKEIWEGDFIHLGDRKILYLVEWFDAGLRPRQISNQSRIGLEYWHKVSEIIGNIHDNPELIKQ